MEIWLSNGVKDKIKIPVNPQSIGAESSSNFEDIILANGDEKTIIGGKNLRSYSIESYFPKKRPYFASSGPISMPINYVRKFDKWMLDKKVLLLQVTSTNINVLVTIRSFTWDEKGGAVGDMDYTLELKEWKPVSYSKIKVVTPGKPAKKPSKRPAPQKNKVKSYTVKNGDSLWKIAKVCYGDGDLWNKIYVKNKATIGSNPNKLKPGQKLVIP